MDLVNFHQQSQAIFYADELPATLTVISTQPMAARQHHNLQCLESNCFFFFVLFCLIFFLYMTTESTNKLILSL